MRISGPLVLNASKWNDHLRPQELIDGGVVSVILGLYQQNINGKIVLNTNCKRIADQIAASNLIMQTFYYVYPESDPYKQADWFINAMQGYPVKFAWADCEDYSAVMSTAARSLSYQHFTERLKSYFPGTGVYTAKWFIDPYAPEMNNWINHYPAWVPHYGHQPKTATMMTWQELKQNWIPAYDIKLAAGQSETNVWGHQFIGKYCYLPGVYCQYDAIPWWPYKGRMEAEISVFLPQFINMIGGNPVPIPPPPAPVPTYKNYKVLSWRLNIRSTPDSSIDTNIVRVENQGAIIQVLTVPFQNEFAKLTDGNFAFAQYLGAMP